MMKLELPKRALSEDECMPLMHKRTADFLTFSYLN